MDDEKKELELFKTKIDLCEFAASRGFCVDLKKTTKKSSVMRRDQEQIVVSVGEKGYYIYFKRGPKSVVDSGTIIDFVQAEYNFSLGKVRVELRKWLGWKNRPKVNPNHFVRVSKRSTAQDLDFMKQYLELWDIDDQRSNVLGYLYSRGISEDIVFHNRFKSTLRTDKFSNIIFPHFLKKCVVGWEIKNHRFTGFPENSTKSVWFSNRFELDDTLILTEAGIEALSFYALFPEFFDHAWCLATAGGWGPESENMISMAIKSFPRHNIITAFNNDNEGIKYTDAIKNILVGLNDNRSPIILKPKSNDWNDDLRASKIM